MTKVKYLTKTERELRANDEIDFFIEKIEKKYKVWVDYNVISIIADKDMACKGKKKK